MKQSARLGHQFGSSAFALAACLAATAAGAQTAPPTDPARAQKPAGDDKEASSAPLADGSTQDIVVTAQRREQRLQEAPVAVTALSAGALTQLNVGDTRDLMAVVPSLQVSTQSGGDSGGSATFFLRGMGQQRSGNGSEPAVGIYVDDFYYPSLQGTVFQVLDLASVEVLRGPQGTLFGRNTIGGAIRYTTKGAELGRFSGHLTGTAGNYDHYDVSGAVNVPIGDFAAIRATGGHLEQGGFVTVQNTGAKVGGSKTDLVRLQARIEPTSSIYVDLSGQYSRFYLNGFAYNVPGPVTPIPPAPGASATLPFIYNRSAVARGLPLYTDAFKSSCYYCHYDTGFPEFSETKYKNALATVGWTIAPGVSLKSLTGWQEVSSRLSTDLDSSPAPIFNGGILLTKTRAFSQELQLNASLLDKRLNFVAGAYYYNERSPGLVPERPNFVIGNPTTPTPTTRNLKSYAGFIDGSFKLTDTLSLLGGFRYSEDHKQIFVTTGRGRSGRECERDVQEHHLSRGRAAAVDAGHNDLRQRVDGLPRRRVQPIQRDADADDRPVRTREGDQLRDRRPTTVSGPSHHDQPDRLLRRLELHPDTERAAQPDHRQRRLVLGNAGKARSYGFEVEYNVGVTEPFPHLRQRRVSQSPVHRHR